MAKPKDGRTVELDSLKFRGTMRAMGFGFAAFTIIALAASFYFFGGYGVLVAAISLVGLAYFLIYLFIKSVRIIPLRKK